MIGPIAIVVDDHAEPIELDRLCDRCGASGDACVKCHRTGFELTPVGKALAAFMKRHVLGD